MKRAGPESFVRPTKRARAGLIDSSSTGPADAEPAPTIDEQKSPASAAAPVPSRPHDTDILFPLKALSHLMLNQCGVKDANITQEASVFMSAALQNIAATLLSRARDISSPEDSTTLGVPSESSATTSPSRRVIITPRGVVESLRSVPNLQKTLGIGGPAKPRPAETAALLSRALAGKRPLGKKRLRTAPRAAAADDSAPAPSLLSRLLGRVVCVDGNAGCGKTVLSNALRRTLRRSGEQRMRTGAQAHLETITNLPPKALARGSNVAAYAYAVGMAAQWATRVRACARSLLRKRTSAQGCAILDRSPLSLASMLTCALGEVSELARDFGAYCEKSLAEISGSVVVVVVDAEPSACATNLRRRALSTDEKGGGVSSGGGGTHQHADEAELERTDTALVISVLRAVARATQAQQRGKNARGAAICVALACDFCDMPASTCAMCAAASDQSPASSLPPTPSPPPKPTRAAARDAANDEETNQDIDAGLRSVTPRSTEQTPPSSPPIDSTQQEKPPDLPRIVRTLTSSDPPSLSVRPAWKPSEFAQPDALIRGAGCAMHVTKKSPGTPVTVWYFNQSAVYNAYKAIVELRKRQTVPLYDGPARVCAAIGIDCWRPNWNPFKRVIMFHLARGHEIVLCAPAGSEGPAAVPRELIDIVQPASGSSAPS